LPRDEEKKVRAVQVQRMGRLQGNQLINDRVIHERDGERRFRPQGSRAGQARPDRSASALVCYPVVWSPTRDGINVALTRAPFTPSQLTPGGPRRRSSFFPFPSRLLVVVPYDRPCAVFFLGLASVKTWALETWYNTPEQPLSFSFLTIL
jgi:hypothetical protein